VGAAYWEIKADEIRRAGWSIGWTAALTEDGELVHVFDAHKGDGRRLCLPGPGSTGCRLCPATSLKAGASLPELTAARVRNAC
jgi:hypothetical protein